MLVTGGGSGLGLSMARCFADLGARVAITGRTVERLEEAAASIDPSGERVLTHAADVRDFSAVEGLLDKITSRFGGIDVLVNNAAGNFLAPTEDLSPNGFNAVVQTVLYGTFHATLAAGRKMIEAGRGREHPEHRDDLRLDGIVLCDPFRRGKGGRAGDDPLPRGRVVPPTGSAATPSPPAPSPPSGGLVSADADAGDRGRSQGAHPDAALRGSTASWPTWPRSWSPMAPPFINGECVDHRRRRVDRFRRRVQRLHPNAARPAQGDDAGDAGKVGYRL